MRDRTNASNSAAFHWDYIFISVSPIRLIEPFRAGIQSRYSHHFVREWVLFSYNSMPEVRRHAKTKTSSSEKAAERVERMICEHCSFGHLTEHWINDAVVNRHETVRTISRAKRLQIIFQNCNALNSDRYKFGLVEIKTISYSRLCAEFHYDEI